MSRMKEKRVPFLPNLNHLQEGGEGWHLGQFVPDEQLCLYRAVDMTAGRVL